MMRPWRRGGREITENDNEIEGEDMYHLREGSLGVFEKEEVSVEYATYSEEGKGTRVSNGKRSFQARQKRQEEGTCDGQ